MNKYLTKSSTAIKTIRKLGINAGLEPGEIQNVIKAWVVKIKNRIVGGIILIKVDTDCTIEWLSVIKKHQNKGLATKLVKLAIIEAKRRNYKNIVISMQIPNFFKRFGFRQVPMDSVSKRFSCYECKRYNKTCFPVVMKLNLVSERRKNAGRN